MGTRKLSVDRPICQQCGNVIEEGRSRSKPPTDAKYCLSCRAERRRRANLKHVWRPEYGVYLKTHYYGGLNRRFQVVNRMICETGLPRWYIKKRASRLGLTMHQNRRPWTAAEEAIVERLLGNVSALTIAKRLKRSETSVVLKIKRMGLSRRVRNGYTMRDLVRDGSVMLFTKKQVGISSYQSRRKFKKRSNASRFQIPPSMILAISFGVGRAIHRLSSRMSRARSSPCSISPV